MDIERLHKEWGVTVPAEGMTSVWLSGALSGIQSRIAQKGCDVVPSVFTQDAAQMFAFPRPRHWRWRSCEEMLRASKPSSVIMRLPIYWQLEIPLFAACREVGVTLFGNNLNNMPVGALAMRKLGIDTIVTTAANAPLFAAELSERGVTQPRAWIVVGAHDDIAASSPMLGKSVQFFAREVHLMPGVPLLTQCAILARSDEPKFHLSSAFAFDMREDASFITDVSDVPFPLVRYKLPFIIARSGVCACGAETVTYRV